MNISAPFIRRPVATTLLMAGITLVGAIAFNVLPVSPLPQVDFPTISVSAGLPGGSPDITASSIATPLERQFSHIAGVTEMTSSSSLGSTSITLQFDLSRDIDRAARDVEAAINAARTYLPANLPANPTYRKVNPADAPILILGLTSDKYDKPTLYDEASSVMAQKLSHRHHTERILPAAGHWSHHRQRARPAGCIVSGDGQLDSANREGHQGRPGGCECHCPYGIRKHRQYQYRAEAAECAEDFRGGCYQSLAA